MWGFRSRLVGALVVCVWFATPSVSRAQTTEDDERARTHFEAGRLYYEEGNYEAALPEFSRAYELSQRPEMLANIANAQERLGRYSDAADSLGEFLATLPSDHAQRVLLERRIANLRERAAATAEVPDAPQAPASSDESPRTVVTHMSDNDLMIPGLVSIGFGALGLAGFGVLGGMALAEESAVRSGCGAARACSPAEVTAMDDLAVAADVSLTIGLLAVATGTLLIGIGEGGRHPVADIALVPTASPNGAGAVVAARF